MRIKNCVCVVVSVLLALSVFTYGTPLDIDTMATPTENISPPEVTIPSKPAEQVTASEPEDKLATPADLLPSPTPPEVTMPYNRAKQVPTSTPEDMLTADLLYSSEATKPSMPAEQATSSKPEDKPCQRWPLTVKFADLGWSDWILTPSDYDAGYCSGDCLPDKLPNATSHAIIQALLNKLHHAVPKPCCVPTELEPVAMLYLDEESNVAVRNHPNMKVKSCGCR